MVKNFDLLFVSSRLDDFIKTKNYHVLSNINATYFLTLPNWNNSYSKSGIVHISNVKRFHFQFQIDFPKILRGSTNSTSCQILGNFQKFEVSSWAFDDSNFQRSTISREFVTLEKILWLTERYRSKRVAHAGPARTPATWEATKQNAIVYVRIIKQNEREEKRKLEGGWRGSVREAGSKVPGRVCCTHSASMMTCWCYAAIT